MNKYTLDLSLFRYFAIIVLSVIVGRSSAYSSEISPYDLLLKSRSANGDVINLSGEFTISESIDAPSKVGDDGNSGFRSVATRYSGVIDAKERLLKLNYGSVSPERSVADEVSNIVIDKDKALIVLYNQAYIYASGDLRVSNENSRIDQVRQWARFPNRIREISPEKVALEGTETYDGRIGYIVRDSKASVAMGMMDVEYLIVPDLGYSSVRTRYLLPGTNTIEIEYLADKLTKIGDVWRPMRYQYLSYKDDLTRPGSRIVKNSTEISFIKPPSLNVDIDSSAYDIVAPKGVSRIVDHTKNIEVDIDDQDALIKSSGMSIVGVGGAVSSSRPASSLDNHAGNLHYDMPGIQAADGGGVVAQSDPVDFRWMIYAGATVLFAILGATALYLYIGRRGNARHQSIDGK